MQNKIFKKINRFLAKHSQIEIVKVDFYITLKSTYNIITIDFFRTDLNLKYTFKGEGTWAKVEMEFAKFLFALERTLQIEKENKEKVENKCQC